MLLAVMRPVRMPHVFGENAHFPASNHMTSCASQRYSIELIDRQPSALSNNALSVASCAFSSLHARSAILHLSLKMIQTAAVASDEDIHLGRAVFRFPDSTI